MANPNSGPGTRVFTVHDSKQLVGMEQLAVEKEVEELLQWIDMIEGMDDSKLKDYVTNRPQNLKSTNREKYGTRKRARQHIKGTEKTKKPDGTGIMASVRKFHKEDEDDSSQTLKLNL